MSDGDPGRRPVPDPDRGDRDGDGPVHPTFRAAALMAVVTLAIFVLSLIAALSGR